MVLSYFLNPTRMQKAPLNADGAMTNAPNIMMLAVDLYKQLFPSATDADTAAFTTQILAYMNRQPPFPPGTCLQKTISLYASSLYIM
jgi:hypothetical protein